MTCSKMPRYITHCDHIKCDLGSGNKNANDIDYFNTTMPTFQINTGSRYTTSVGGTSFGSKLLAKWIESIL